LANRHFFRFSSCPDDRRNLQATAARRWLRQKPSVRRRYRPSPRNWPSFSVELEQAPSPDIGNGNLDSIFVHGYIFPKISAQMTVS